MGYSKFMQQLSRGIESKIVAYDGNSERKAKEDGCMIYLRGHANTLFVPHEIIEHKCDEAIQAVRQKLSEEEIKSPLLVLTEAGGKLVFEEPSAGSPVAKP